MHQAGIISFAPRRYLAGLLLAALLSGCAARPQEPVEIPAQRFPYRAVINFDSRLDNPYYVLSGPIETYRRIPFNDWCRQALARYRQTSFAAEAEQTLTIDVELLELRTRYGEFGMVPHRSALTLFAGLDYDNGSDVPAEIRKGATLVARVRLHTPGREIAATSLDATYATVAYGENFDTSSYDYGPVLRAVIHQLLLEVNALLPERL